MMQFTNEKDLQNIVLSAPIGICILNADNLTAEMLNDKFLDVAGKPRESIIGKFYWEPFAEARPFYEVALAGVVASGEPFYANEVELMLVRHGREEKIFVTFVYTPVKDDAGKVRKVAVWVLENTLQVIEREKVSAAKAILQGERDRLREFFMQAPAGICILSGPELVFELVNPGYQEILPGRVLLDRPIFEALPELVGTPLQQTLLNVYHTGKPYVISELLIPVADKEGGLTKDRYFSFNYQARRDENNEVDGIMVFVFEVTALIESQQDHLAMNEELATMNEELTTSNEALVAMQQALLDTNTELSENESRLQMAIETSHLGTWDYLIQEDKLFLSGEARAIFGLPGSATVTFAALTALVYQDDSAAFWNAVHRALNNNGSYELTCRIVRANDGVQRWVRVRGNVQINSAGEGTRNMATLLDVTESKIAEEKNARLAAIIASSDDAIISKTFESVITSWNDAAGRIFGYSAGEMIGETIYKLIPADRQEEEPMILARLRSGERVEHFETKRQTKDGRLIDVSVTISPVKDGEGNIIGLSKIARDITEKKQDETRKSDFIGMVSHELKTPLTSLNAIIQVANYKMHASGDPFLSGAMAKASVQVKRMTAMINGFLNISRLESGKMLIEKEDFELDQLINEIIDETRLIVTSHTVEFTVCDPVTVHADRDKISSVISNLLNNAVKYSPRGKLIVVNCTVSADNVQVSVCDEGMGIKPHDLERIFDRYYRVETDHTRHISGFGIGLYLSAEIVHRHGGSIWAESESGKGSTFYFSLPLR